nr:hypothetical protein [Tanacetum cinerariifolium]
MWRMLLDRLPNRLNLSSRGLDSDSISCMVCNRHVESNDHIFFTCDTAVAIWNLVRSWIDLPLPRFLSCEDWTNWFDSWHVSKDKKSRMYSIFAATCWTLWRFRNNITFISHSMRKCDIFDFIRNVSFSWLKYRARFSSEISLHSSYAFLGSSLAMLAFSNSTAKFITTANFMLADEPYPPRFVSEP